MQKEEKMDKKTDAEMSEEMFMKHGKISCNMIRSAMAKAKESGDEKMMMTAQEMFKKHCAA